MSLPLVFALMLLATACGSVAARPAGRSNETTGRIQLPRDQAMHPQAQSEWWYLIGHLLDSKHRAFGFETTLFKLRRVKINGYGGTISVDRADIALTDVVGRRFLHSVTYVLPGSGDSHLSSTSFSERVDGASIRGNGERINLQASSSGFRLRLHLTDRRRPMLEGGEGIVPMGSNAFSYYYSLVDLEVLGRLRYHGRWLAVHGVAWMDHQWGTWAWNHVRGWTWAAFQLNGGVAFSASDFHATGGSLHGVTVSYPNGRQQTVRGVTFRGLGRWRSPKDGSVYSSGWWVAIPKLRATLTVLPYLRDQEVYDPQARESYWEGDCLVAGRFEGKQVTGQAYVELVGPGGRF